MTRNVFKDKDFILIIVLFLLNTFYLINTTQINHNVVSEGGYEPGPSLFPILIIVSLYAGTLVLVIQFLLRYRRQASASKGIHVEVEPVEMSDPQSRAEEGNGMTVKQAKLRILYMFFFFLIYIFLLKGIGFIIATTIASFLVLAVVYRFGWIKSIVSSVLLSVFAYLIFGIFLDVPL